MSWQALRHALALEPLDAPSKLVHVLLADMANASSQCWPSQALLVERSGLSRRGVQLALTRLEGAGRITRAKRSAGKGRGRATDLVTLQGVEGAPCNGYKAHEVPMQGARGAQGISKEPSVDSSLSPYMGVGSEDEKGRLWV